MKSKILMMAAALTVVGGLSVAPSAQAFPSHGGGFHGGGFHSSVGFRGGHGYYGHGYRYGGFGWGLAGGLVAGALLSPYYGYPYYGYGDYYDPAYVDSGSVAVYDDSSTPIQAAPTTSAPPVWYYCHSPKGYYPYVPSCSSGWQQVPAVPPH